MTNQDTPTPRTDAAWWEADRDSMILVDADFARTLERELTAARADTEMLTASLRLSAKTNKDLLAEVETLRVDYGLACKLVADMHAAATGRPGEGPRLGVLEDVAAVRAEVEALRALLPGPYYMDPPDGGDVPIVEQMRRMAKDAERYRWLREGPVITVYVDVSDGILLTPGFVPKLGGFPEKLDAAIDAALAKEKAHV